MSDFVNQRQLTMLQQNVEILDNIFQKLSPQIATTLRDGPDGWTSLEVLCHLRDFDVIFQERAELMLNEDNPTFKGYDHEAMVVERAYNAQNIAEVLTSFKASRAKVVAFYEGLNEAQRNRPGVHPVFGAWSVKDHITFIGWHDVNHIEQITRILVQA